MTFLISSRTGLTESHRRLSLSLSLSPSLSPRFIYVVSLVIDGARGGARRAGGKDAEPCDLTASPLSSPSDLLRAARTVSICSIWPAPSLRARRDD